MSDFTEQEFNEAMARLDGFVFSGEPYPFDDPIPDYYNDLNLLMPLAWKYKLYVYPLTETKWASVENSINFANNSDPIQAIRDCLWQLTKEGE